jgi:hypothetical protein
VVVGVFAGTIAPAVGNAVLSAAAPALSATPALVTGAVTLSKAVVLGAATGAGMSASMTAIQGGSTSDILNAGVRGAVTGGIQGALSFGIGQAFNGVGEAMGGELVNGAWKGLSTGQEFILEAGRAAVHGAAQGGIQEVQGGEFRDGFIGAATGAAVGHSGLAGMFGNQTALLRTVGAALAGGTASALAGGKFANGALSAAFTHLFNYEMHQVSDFFAGAADSITFGLTKRIRVWMGADAVSDGSSAYGAGGTTAKVAETATGLPGLAKAGVRFGLKRAAKSAPAK